MRTQKAYAGLPVSIQRWRITALQPCGQNCQFGFSSFPERLRVIPGVAEVGGSTAAEMAFTSAVYASALAVGILLDAVVVRTLLVPALISLIGRWNWWLPDPLTRALRVGAPSRARHGDGSIEATTRSG